MGFLAGIFESAHNDVSLHERAILEIAPHKGGLFQSADNDTPENYDARVINFQYILDTGNIPQVTTPEGGNIWWGSDTHWGSQRIDWNADDAFTRSLDGIENEVNIRIRGSDALNNLPEDKASWQREHHIIWEKEVAGFVSEEMDKIPAFSEYRLSRKASEQEIAEGADNDSVKYSAQYRATELNDLSNDIENGTMNVRFVCQEMSAVEGALMQRVSNSHNVGTNFFYTKGTVNVNASSDSLGGHAYVVSSATGNVIESTVDPSKSDKSSYKENVNPNYRFEDLVHGEMAVLTDGSIYGGHNIDMGDVAVARHERGEIDVSDMYSRINSDWVVGGDEKYPRAIETLAELKGDIEVAEARLESSNLSGRNLNGAKGVIARMKSEFEDQVQDFVNNGQIYEMLEFVDEKEQAHQEMLAERAEIDANIQKLEDKISKYDVELPAAVTALRELGKAESEYITAGHALEAYTFMYESFDNKEHDAAKMYADRVEWLQDMDSETLLTAEDISLGKGQQALVEMQWDAQDILHDMHAKIEEQHEVKQEVMLGPDVDVNELRQSIKAVADVGRGEIDYVAAKHPLLMFKVEQAQGISMYDDVIEYLEGIAPETLITAQDLVPDISEQEAREIFLQEAEHMLDKYEGQLNENMATQTDFSNNGNVTLNVLGQ